MQACRVTSLVQKWLGRLLGGGIDQDSRFTSVYQISSLGRRMVRRILCRIIDRDRERIRPEDDEGDGCASCVLPCRPEPFIQMRDMFETLARPDTETSLSSCTGPSDRPLEVARCLLLSYSE